MQALRKTADLAVKLAAKGKAKPETASIVPEPPEKVPLERTFCMSTSANDATIVNRNSTMKMVPIFDFES